LKTSGQIAHCALDHGRVSCLKQEGFRIGCGPTAAVLLFIERVGYAMAGVTTPAITRVTNDSEEPGAAASARKCSEVSKRPQRRFLHDVLRILVIPRQPARQPVGGVEVREDDFIKTGTACVCRDGLWNFVIH
jgi:hypothetical protein